MALSGTDEKFAQLLAYRRSEECGGAVGDTIELPDHGLRHSLVSVAKACHSSAPRGIKDFPAAIHNIVRPLTPDDARELTLQIAMEDC